MGVTETRTLLARHFPARVLVASCVLLHPRPQREFCIL